MLTIVICVVLFLLGAVLCVTGARLYRLWFASVGLITGVLAGYQVGLQFFGQEAYGLIFALVLGVLFACFFALLVPVGVTLSSAFLFGLIVTFLLGCFGLAGLWWVILMGAMIGAILGAMFSRALIVIGSALQGGYLMVISVLAILQTRGGRSLESIETDPMTALLVLIIALALGFIGAALQSRNLRLGRHHTMEPVMRRDGKAKITNHRLLQNKTEILPIKKFHLD